MSVLLIVDDEPGKATLVTMALSEHELGQQDGLDLLRQLRGPTPVVVFSIHDSQKWAAFEPYLDKRS